MSTIEVRRVSIEEVQSVLREVEGCVAPDKYALLQDLFDGYVELMRKLSEQTMTLARLRKLFHLKTSERLVPPTPEEPRDDAEPQSERPSSPSTSEPPEAESSSAAASGVGQGETAVPEPPDANPKKRPGHGRNPGSAYAGPNTHVEHPELKAGQRCPDCARGSLYLLRKTAPVVQINGQPPLVASTYTAESLRCSTCGQVFTAPIPEEAKGPRFKASAIAMIAYLHYLCGMPFERLDGIQKDAGVPIAASVQWKRVDEASTDLKPVYERLIYTGARASGMHIDDSPMKILELMGKRRPHAIEAGLITDPKRTGIQTTGFISFDPNAPPVALFFTGPKHAGENLEALLKRRPLTLDKPIVMSDALSRNVPAHIRPRVIEANCMSHGRRGIFDQLENFPVEARHVLTELAKIFAVDKEARCENLDSKQRMRLHQRKSGPVLGRLRQWIRIKVERKKVIEPNSELGKALRYILKHWAKLTRFLRVPGAPITNNICERLLKTAIRYRKNSSFYKTLHGAQVGDLFMSLMQTARLNGVDPLRYLTALLENRSAVAANPEGWTPWAYEATLADLAHTPVHAAA